MKRKFLTYFALFLFFAFILPLFTAVLVEAEIGEKPRFNIVTIDSKPIYIDKILYKALEDSDYQAEFTPMDMDEGYSEADSGVLDGVVSALPDMQNSYPNLIRVPVVLEESNIYAFVRRDSDLEINSWEDFAGKRVGLLPNRLYLENSLPADVKRVFARTNISLVNALLNGRCDVIAVRVRPGEIPFSNPGIRQAAQFGELTDYFYVNQKHAALVPELTESIARFYQDGTIDKLAQGNIDIKDNIPKTVLHFISSSMETKKEELFLPALRDPFADDNSIEWYSLAFETRNFFGVDRLGYFSRLLRKDLTSRNVAAIVVSGDEAMNFVRNHYDSLFKGVPVLFYDIDEAGYDKKISGYEDYFTGIVEHVSADETIELALNLFPDTKNVYVLNDYTSEGRDYKDAIEKQLQPLSGRVKVTYSENLPMKELIEDIKNLPPDTAVLVGSYFIDANGQYHSQSETQEMMENNCAVPVFTVRTTALLYNALGGKCVDYAKYGQIIAERLQQILQGGSVKDMPVLNSGDNNRWVFNKMLMDKFHITETSLPASSEIINRPLSLWATDPKFASALTALLLMGFGVSVALSVFLYQYVKQKESLSVAEELLFKDEQIKKAKELLEIIINTAPVAYLLTIDNTIVESNKHSNSIFDIKPGDDVEKLYESKADRHRILRRVTEEHAVTGETIKYRLKNGESHLFLTNFSAVEYNGQRAYVLWGMDIEHLDIARQSMQSVLDALPVPVAIADTESASLVYLNDMYTKILGHDLGEGPITLRELVPPLQSDGTTDAAAMLNFILNISELDVREIQILTSAKQIIDVRSYMVSINYNGRASIIGILIDLSAEKEYERMLLSATEKEKEANQLKSRFLVNMSHEIRTPMNAVIGLTAIELRKQLPAQTKEVYKKINMSANNLLNIINDILDLSKIEANKIELFEEAFDLEELLNSALLVVAQRLEGKKVDFMLSAALNLPRFIVGDKTRVWQVLKNFLDNSAKYTDAGKIVLTVLADHEKSTADTVWLSFVVEDTGIGMSEEEIQKLFMPYKQIYNEAQKKYTGTGLGMVISKQLCEIMGGKLDVGSRVGEGTIIHLSIPFARAENTEMMSDAIKVPALKDVRVLAVDDDERSLSIIASLLSGSGAKCEVAATSREALKLIVEHSNSAQPFDLVILDYLLEDLDGLKTGRKIQTAVRKIPKMLLMTAQPHLVSQHELGRSGIADIIEKPFTPSQFVNKVSVALGHGAISKEKAPDEYTQFKDVTVLICEDYYLNSEIAVEMLSQFGISAAVAVNGKEGVEILRSGRKFDLIFMDLQMPVMDGYGATRLIRADKRFDAVPVISLTADAMKEVISKCEEVGMNDYLTKPINFESLQKVLLKWLPKDKQLLRGGDAAGDAVSAGTDAAGTDAAALADAVINNTAIDNAALDNTIVDNADANKVADAAADEARQTAIARFGGKVALYEKMLALFAKDLPAEWAEFEMFVENEEEAKGFVHKIKGAAGNLSETAIYNHAVEFEKSLREGAPDKTGYENLVKACNTLKNKLAGE